MGIKQKENIYTADNVDVSSEDEENFSFSDSDDKFGDIKKRKQTMPVQSTTNKKQNSNSRHSVGGNIDKNGRIKDSKIKPPKLNHIKETDLSAPFELVKEPDDEDDEIQMVSSEKTKKKNIKRKKSKSSK